MGWCNRTTWCLNLYLQKETERGSNRLRRATTLSSAVVPFKAEQAAGCWNLDQEGSKASKLLALESVQAGDARCTTFATFLEQPHSVTGSQNLLVLGMYRGKSTVQSKPAAPGLVSHWSGRTALGSLAAQKTTRFVDFREVPVRRHPGDIPPSVSELGDNDVFQDICPDISFA